MACTVFAKGNSKIYTRDHKSSVTATTFYITIFIDSVWSFDYNYPFISGQRGYTYDILLVLLFTFTVELSRQLS